MSTVKKQRKMFFRLVTSVEASCMNFVMGFDHYSQGAIFWKKPYLRSWFNPSDRKVLTADSDRLIPALYDKILCSPGLWYCWRDKWGFIPCYGTQHGDEAQTEIDLKFHLLPLKCPKPYWENDEHVPTYNISVHMVRQHVTWLSHDYFFVKKRPPLSILTYFISCWD